MFFILISHLVLFQVKSSNNTNYRVKPVYGFVEPKGEVALEINRSAGTPKDDKLVIQWAEVSKPHW